MGPAEEGPGDSTTSEVETSLSNGVRPYVKTKTKSKKKFEFPSVVNSCLSIHFEDKFNSLTPEAGSDSFQFFISCQHRNVVDKTALLVTTSYGIAISNLLDPPY
jgi:hypothetical protein